MGLVSREAGKAAKRDGRWADADTQRNQGRERGRADAIGGLSWCLCVLSEAGVGTLSLVRGGMGRVSREAAKAAKRDGRWADADTQRKRSREGEGRAAVGTGGWVNDPLTWLGT